MRRAALIGVSAAAALALGGGALAACGGEGGKPYVAVDAAGSGPEAAPGGAVPPHGRVELVPLDGAGDATGRGRGAAAPTRAAPSGTTARSGGGNASGGGSTAAGPGAGNSTGGPAPGGGSTSAGGGAGGGGTPGTGDSDSGGASGGTSGGASTTGGGSPGGTTTPPTPAALTLGTLTRTPTPTRRCENVTVPLRNTGTTPVRSGTLTFATHVIGLLGIDWATVTSTQPLGPVPAATATSRTYEVCLDAWRVPLGTHIETRSVTADWR
ncbi:hypothetical protein [Streptomyces crystallinus]|uniref:Secreted protein n=1 Tax=Streptomyces crystallinus TaxID=68191 RepID=A0ABP3R662_9ACTN